MKVGDFGLAEDMYSTGYVRDASKTVKVPYKWMPPESLEEGLFSEKSDVVSATYISAYWEDGWITLHLVSVKLLHVSVA